MYIFFCQNALLYIYKLWLALINYYQMRHKIWVGERDCTLYTCKSPYSLAVQWPCNKSGNCTMTFYHTMYFIHVHLIFRISRWTGLNLMACFWCYSFRAQFSIDDVPLNQFHGSDSLDTANQELEFFFPMQQTVAAIKPDGFQTKGKQIKMFAYYRVVSIVPIILVTVVPL